jgi:hypothetical protein
MTGAKTTSPGWPDPADWLKRLEAVCRERAESYLKATAQRNHEPGSYSEAGVLIETVCLLEATGVLSALASALHELPTFRDNPANVAFNDLTIALHDLAVGGSPALLQRGERNRDRPPVEADTVIAYATLSVRLLKEGHDFTDSAARRCVAEIMAKHGIRGRKGGPLSASTLQDWQDTYAAWPVDHPAREAIERKWGEWTGNPGWMTGRDLNTSISWITKLVEQPIFQNKAARARL